jgi:hypothetical protein
MKRGIIKPGDVVKFIKKAQLAHSQFGDDLEHVVSRIETTDMYGNTNLECAVFEDGDAADVFWLKRVLRRTKTELSIAVDNIYNIFDSWTDLGAEDEEKKQIKNQVMEILKKIQNSALHKKQ